MKTNVISKNWLVVLVFIGNAFMYSMEQDKPSWRYANNIAGELDKFDFSVDEKKLGLNFDYKVQLVPDDVSEPSRWKKDLKKPPYNLPEIFTDYINIRKRFTYTPPEVKDSQPITWLVVHGTFGHETPDYFDDQDLKFQNFRHIKRAASAYATKKGKKLELLSYVWASWYRSKAPGGLSDTDRIKAAEILHKFLQQKKYYENSEMVILSHSHGCNMINYLSRLTPKENPIELLIHFGCPRRTEEQHYQPLNYKKLIYFFSDGDLITVLGRLPEKEYGKLAMDIGNVTKKVVKSFIIPTEGHCMEVSDSIDILKSYFKGFNEFSPPKKAISYNESSNVHALGLHTQIDDEHPGHSPIVNSVKYLDIIMEKLSNDFGKHINAIFKLKIDNIKAPNINMKVEKENIKDEEDVLAKDLKEETKEQNPTQDQDKSSRLKKIKRVARTAAVIGWGGTGTAVVVSVALFKAVMGLGKVFDNMIP